MIEVGLFVIAGDWDATPTPQGKIRIVMPPLGHVFGAGWHGVTQAALRALPNHVRAGESFAEIGAGSGILSVAAKKLGAGRCIATEISPDAIEAAQKVFAANNVEVELVKGTFPKEQVDLALVSISDAFYEENKEHIKAKRVLVVRDDESVEAVK